MNTLLTTAEFTAWLRKLKNPLATARIASRLNAARNGNFGVHKSVGEGVMERKIDTGPGYRLYYAREESTIYILLLGGDKSEQIKDIQRAKTIWKEIQEQRNG